MNTGRLITGRPIPPAPARHVRRRGIALVITLGAVTLLSLLIIAFFTHAQTSRKISFSSSNQLQAQMLATTALDLVVGELREEIADPGYSKATTVGGLTQFRPLSPQYLLPERTGVDTGQADAVGKTTIVGISANGSGVYDNSGLTGSSVAITAPSLNGRKQTRWYTDGPQLGTANMPTWIFLAQGQGPVATPNTTAKPTDSAYIIGRFAYTIYDIAGLLNANAAGYPTSMETDPEHYPAIKSSQAMADLSPAQLEVNANSLVNWRNSQNAASPTAYASYLENTAAPSGFLQTDVGDQAFLSRRDLLAAAKAGVGGLSDASPSYLTAFSRSLSLPEWSPTNPPVNPDGSGASIDYVSQASIAGSTNRNLSDVRFTSDADIIHFRDDGTIDPFSPSETGYSYSVKAGDPLIQRRFSLAKLAWLTPTGPASSLPNAAASIRACFGLEWNNADERWDYVAEPGNGTIATLDTVATLGREPNFFELLKAGILSGSLGLSANAKTLETGTPGSNSPKADLDANRDLHILRIGANIIDCADTDNYPTRLAVTLAGTPIIVAGVEDLPYLYYMGVVNPRQYTLDSTNTKVETMTDLDLAMYPVLWNPHQPSGETTTSGPTEIQVKIANGSLIGNIVCSNTTLNVSPNATARDLTRFIPINVTSDTFETYRNTPSPIYKSGGTYSAITLIPYIGPAAANIQIFHLYSWSQNYTSDAVNVRDPNTNLPRGPNWPEDVPPTGTGISSSYFQTANLIITQRYRSPRGVFKTYLTLGGDEAFPINTGIEGARDLSAINTSNVLYFGPWILNVNKDPYGNPLTYIRDFYTAYYIGNWDPRSSRLGAYEGWNIYNYTRHLPVDGSTSGHLGVRLGTPFQAMQDDLAANKTGRYFPSAYANGDKTGQISGGAVMSNNFPDPDGIYRPADSWLNPWTDDKTTPGTRRPVILQRPYRSVGELGYVFRDTPWKTLSFFDATSADAGLLNLFSLTEEPALTAGRVALASRQQVTQEALLRQSAESFAGTDAISDADATAIAAAFQTQSFPGGLPAATTPVSTASIATLISDQQAALPLDKEKFQRETVARALADTTQSRTWNLLIDVVVQTGRYPGTGTPAAADFQVEGEKRYWLSVAIDRLTGRVIDQQLEPVTE